MYAILQYTVRQVPGSPVFHPPVYAGSIQAKSRRHAADKQTRPRPLLPVPYTAIPTVRQHRTIAVIATALHNYTRPEKPPDPVQKNHTIVMTLSAACRFQTRSISTSTSFVLAAPEKRARRHAFSSSSSRERVFPGSPLGSSIAP